MDGRINKEFGTKKKDLSISDKSFQSFSIRWCIAIIYKVFKLFKKKEETPKTGSLTNLI